MLNTHNNARQAMQKPARLLAGVGRQCGQVDTSGFKKIGVSIGIRY